MPAAYVSGYLRTVPRPGSERLAGRRRHACLGAGVVRRRRPAGAGSTRPTRILAGDDHVVLAIGRDYADVAPIDGVVFASGGQKINVAVSVIPVG